MGIRKTKSTVKHFALWLIFIFTSTISFGQFADTSELNNYLRDTITDRRPNKVSARQVQKALLGSSNLFAAKYKSYSAIVSLSAGVFTTTILNNDFGGTTFTFSNPSNGFVEVTASSAVYTTNKTASAGSTLDNAGTPYFLTGSGFSSTVFVYRIVKYDGTQTGTPNFTNAFFEIRVYN